MRLGRPGDIGFRVVRLPGGRFRMVANDLRAHKALMEILREDMRKEDPSNPFCWTEGKPPIKSRIGFTITRGPDGEFLAKANDFDAHRKLMAWLDKEFADR